MSNNYTTNENMIDNYNIDLYSIYRNTLIKH